MIKLRFPVTQHIGWWNPATVMRFESKRGPKRKKEKKPMFCNLEAYFSSCYFFIIPLPLHLKDEFR